MTSDPISIVGAVSAVVIFIAFCQNALYSVQLIFATRAVLKRPPETNAKTLWQRYKTLCPPITLVVPAFNESQTVIETVTSLLALQYPSFEVIVVNDGSSDDTLDKLRTHFRLDRSKRFYEPQLPHKPIKGIYTRSEAKLVVIDKENGGKADAQNAGVNVSRSPLVCVIDGDSILESDALLRAARPFIENPDETIAVGGSIRIANETIFKHGRLKEMRLPRKAVSMFQIVEYLRAFLIARMAWSSVNSLMLVSGAFSMFRRQELIEVNGFEPGSLGEDLDMTVKLHRHMRQQKKPYRIEFIADPVCWTEAPEQLNVLRRQRIRWQKGAIEVFWRYRGMLFNPRYGRVGFVGYPQLLVFDVLGPVAEALGFLLLPLFWALGLLSVGHLLSFIGLIFAFGVFTSVTSVLLAELETRRFPRARDLARLTAYAIVENFGYRQINTYWRVVGLIQALGSDKSWGEMPRRGFAQPPSLQRHR